MDHWEVMSWLELAVSNPILFVTNDFGPRAGGIETFVIGLIERRAFDQRLSTPLGKRALTSMTPGGRVSLVSQLFVTEQRFYYLLHVYPITSKG